MSEDGHKRVGVVYDERMLQPHSEWDPSFPECPDRASLCWDRCQEQGLVECCHLVPARMAKEEEVLLCHSPEYLQLLKSLDTKSLEERKELSSHYDGVYFHPKTYEASMLAAGSTVELTQQVVTGKLHCGLAITRPPGHHSQEDKPNGYCILNNVAIAAKHAVDNLGLKRVLIVDWDVHHGQGVQYMFYDDPRVLYFSIHRYEFGKFWPNLRESDYDHIGKHGGMGYNINVPFNETGMTNADYLAIIQQILLPVAHQFKPELVLVCAGYDAALGDPEGMSEVTPVLYSHITHMLKAMAGGKLVAVLEGGYCMKSQAESVALTLRELLGHPCVSLGPLGPPKPSTVEMILNVIRVLRPYWRTLAYHTDAETEDDLPEQFVDVEMPKKGVEFATEDNRSAVYALSEDYEKHSQEVLERMAGLVTDMIANIHVVNPADRTCLVYDSDMRLHKCRSDSECYSTHPERADRITRIYDRHRELGLLDRCKQLKSRVAKQEEVALVHGEDYISQLKGFQLMDMKELRILERSYSSIYLSQDVYDCATLAAGCTLNVVDEVITGRCQNGVAIVRPPGHHAEPHAPMGFCYINSVGVAARYAQKTHGIERVLILDWDIHHGNGTQLMFEQDPSILYISIHRYDHGGFFPAGPEGDYDFTGIKKGVGSNINIPWNNKTMGDAEYVAAFQQLVLPVAYQFDPELVLVSAGFDAAKGDPLGGYKVSPGCYGYMTHMLSSLACGKVILVLEGGYNLCSISDSMAACTAVLLGDPCPAVTPGLPCDSAVTTLKNVLDTQKEIWSCLRYRVMMPSREDTKAWLRRTLGLPEDTEPEAGSQDKVAPTAQTADLQVKVKPEPIATDLSTENPKSKTDTDIASPKKLEFQKDIKDEITFLPTNMSDNKENHVFTDAVNNEGGAVEGGYEDNTEELTGDMAKVSVSSEDCDAVVPDGILDAHVAVADGKGSADREEEEVSGACGGSAAGDDRMEMHSVVPLPWCPHLATVNPLPLSGELDVLTPCEECGNVGENWVCLTCYEVHCSRYVNEHMLFHGLERSHVMVLSYADLSVWCYGCDSYVHNEEECGCKPCLNIHMIHVATRRS